MILLVQVRAEARTYLSVILETKRDPAASKET
jgi:hypothetical protein